MLLVNVGQLLGILFIASNDRFGGGFYRIVCNFQAAASNQIKTFSVVDLSGGSC